MQFTCSLSSVLELLVKLVSGPFFFIVYLLNFFGKASVLLFYETVDIREADQEGLYVSSFCIKGGR